MAPDASNNGERKMMQRYGALTTSLNEALANARRLLEPHSRLLSPTRLAELDAVLAEFARRRIRIAFYGEVKAGKSTLINALAGSELSPVAFEPLTSVAVRVTYGNATVWRVGERTVDSIAELARIMREEDGAAEVVVATDLDLLQLGGQVDIVDTPGIGTEERFDLISAEALRSLDAVVLVVRYPALFTRLTQKLMKELEADIGKLFVVWNLDSACSELSADERARHAETLRARVAGAHELYLVDARAAFRAAVQSDRVGIESSGLASFREALARFAASEKREVVALREAAKRAARWLEEGTQALGRRKAELDSLLTGARRRLQAVRDAADARRREAQRQFEEFQSSVAQAVEQRALAARESAATLRKRLRGARRRWVRTGDFGALEDAVAVLTTAYADAVANTASVATQSLQEAARRFGSTVQAAPWVRQVPSVEALAPEKRKERAAAGRARLLRRAVWCRWYLPGLRVLAREAVERDLASQSSWFETAVRAVEEAARKVLESRLSEIGRQAEAEMKQIKAEVRFEESEAEFNALARCLPELAAQRERVGQINAEARVLMQ